MRSPFTSTSRPDSASYEGATAPRAHRPPASKWFVFAIVSMALMMGSIDSTIVATALQNLHQSLHASLSWTSWTITGYSLGVVVAMPIMGRIADQFGRKRIFLLMVLIFTVASMLCGLATDIYMLLAARVVQAIGGGAFMPVAVGIVSERFEGDRDRAIGMFTSIFPIGALIGPVLGGTIIAAWSWRGIFLINIPIGCLLLVLGHKYLPVSPRKAGARADVRGAVLLGITLVSMMYGITELGGAHSSLLSVNFLIPEAISIFFGANLLRHMRGLDDPIIPLHLLRSRSFASMNLIAFVFGGGAVGFGSLVPLYAQYRYHFTSFEAGTVLTARGIGAIAVAGATSFLLRRTGYRLPMLVGFFLNAFGVMMLAIGSRWTSDYSWIAVGALIMGLGGGIASPASNNALLSQAPDEIASLSGLRGMFRQAGGIVSVSVVTAIASRSVHPALAIADSFLIFAAFIFAVILPLVFTIPQHRGTW